MKKLILILLLLPLIASAQNRYTYVDTAAIIVYSTPLDKNVGDALIVGGTLMALGAVSNIIASQANWLDYDKDGIPTPSSARLNEQNKKIFSAVGYSMYGLSTFAFITAGILYKDQVIRQRKVIIYVSPAYVSMVYKF